MIEPDINERMARFAPSQNMGDPGDDAIERAVAGMAGVPARPQFEQDADIDAAVLQIAGERRQDMAASLMAASQVNPDQAARASKLGEQFGVGQDIALRNMQELEREATVRDIQRMDLMRNDPVLARYLSDRAFASEAQDDVGVLSKLRPLVMEAALISAFGPAPILKRGFERGSLVAERGDIGTKAMAGFTTQADFDRVKQIEEEMRTLGQMGILGTTAEMVGQNVAQLRTIGTTAAAGAGVGSFFGPAGTVIGGGIGATAGVVGSTASMEAGNLYLDLRDEGVSDDTAIPTAIAGGFLNGVIEVAGMKIAAKPFQALAKRVMAEAVSDAIKKPTMRAALAAAGKGYLMQVGAEGAEEALQETVIIAGEEIAKAVEGVDSETGMRQAVDRVLESFMYGAMGASILGGVGPGANLFVDLRRASNSERQQRFFDGLAANGKESRLAQRSPVGYERFLASQAEGTTAETIYVDGRIAQQVLAQSGVPTAQLEEILPGIRERISEAVQTGGDVTIPTARFGARLANTDLGNALLPHMRLSPDAMSATEAQEFATRRQEVVREAEQILAQKQEADATFVQQARQIHDRIRQQAIAAGQEPAVADVAASMYQAFVVTQAAEEKITPAQVESRRRRPLTIEQVGELAAAAPLEQAVLNEQMQRWLQSDVMIRPADPRWETARPFGQFPTVTAEGRPRFEGEVTQTSLAEIVPEGRMVFHETNLNSAKALMSRILEGPRRHAPFFVSDNIDLALGQAGRGYIIELDPQFSNGQQVDVAERKPGLAMTEAAGAGTELRIDKTLRQSLRSVIVPNQRGLEALRRVPGLSERLDFDNPTQTERGLQINLKVAAAPGVMEQAAMPSQLDAQHRESIKAGDIATAQALTDAAAESRMPDSKVRDKAGKILRVFHGTQRIDRVGNRLLKKRATSGPMPFFTNTRPIAEGYAQGKQDTSIENIGYEQWVKYTPKGQRSKVTLDQAWFYLTPEQKATATERLFTTGYENPNEGTGAIVGDTDTITSRDHVEYLLREARGNALTAAKELWLNSGSLFNEEQQFMDVLKGMGLTERFVYDSPHAVNSGIIEAYLNITNPLDTAAIPESVVEALQRRSNRRRQPAAQYGRDHWDKETRNPQEWMATLRSDIAEGKTQAWTSIPDWVTDVLRGLGYDGIKDMGGKFGGEQHTVWIPFEPEQVKFADAIAKDASGRLIPLSERFDVTSPMMYFQAAAGPARGGFDPRRVAIMLTRATDRTTMWHELVHFFLNEYTEMVADGSATARTRNDLDLLLKWFKIEGDTADARFAKWVSMSLEEQRKHHEALTYNAEIYAFEGKAPSAELVPVFERLRAFMLRVYKSIRDDLNAIYRREFGEDLPILTGEVRQVMDRMLATDEQIKRQAAINEMKPQFQTQEQSGMDDAEWAAYQAMQQEAIEASVTDMNKASMRQLQWLGNARSRILRDMQKKHDAKRKEVASEVAADLRVEPVYRAMTYLRTGKFIDSDGAEVTVEGPHRLDTKRTQAIYAGLPTETDMEAVRATGMAMPKVFAPDIAKLGTGKYGMLGVDGLDPDVVAETFGFGSGDQMIRALLEAKPIKEAVAERTDAEMLRRYGDMNTPEAQEAEVQKALHNEARARFVAVELRHVARATEPVRVMLEAAKQVARELIAGMTLREVRPADFIAAEARAARDAGRMGATVNPEAVGQAAQTRAYNEAIDAGTDPAEAMAAAIEKGAEAARKAQERSDAIKAQYGADPQQALIRAKRAQLYQNQLAAEALRVREEVAKQVKYLRRILRDTNVKAMGAQAADQVAALLERFEVAPVSLKRLDERKALETWLDEQEAAGLVPDIAPEVANEARRVNYQQLTVAEFRDLVDAIRQIEFIGKNERKVQLAAERAAYEEKRDEIVTRIRAVGRLRGVKFDPRSPLTNIGRSAAALRGFAAQHLKAASVARILDGGEDDGPLWTFAIRSANAAADMETRMRAEASAKLAEILAPVFALGNMGGKGVFFPSINLNLNREARIAIAMNVGNDGNRQRLLDGEGWTMEQVQPVLESLTEAEWKTVQQVWDYIDTYRPLIAEKERRLYGKEPEWVKPTPFTTRTADGREVRLEGGYYPIKYDPVASNRVATLDEVKEAKRALDGAYTAATTQRSFTKSRAAKPEVGPLLYTLDAAFGGVNDVIHDLSWHEWLIQTQRLLRDPEFKTAVTETRGPDFLKQLKDWANDNAAGERKIGVAGEAALSWLRKGISASGLGFNIVSAIMQVTGFNQSIVRLGAKYVGRGVAQFAGSPIDTARMVADKSSFMAERGRTQFREINEIRNRVRGQTKVARRVTAGTYFLMMNMQRTVDIPTWLAGYQKALDAGKDDATAVALADQAVRDTQGSGLISDLAAIERGGPVMKLFTVFYSYMNTVYNMTAVQTMTARSKGKLAADYAMLLVVPVVLGQAIKNLIQPDAGDDELDPEALARKLAAEELSFLMGTMVIAREFGGAAQLLTGAEGVRMGYGGPAGLRAVGEVYGLATQAGQLEFDRAFRRSAINTLGAFTGLPSAQVNRTIDGIEAVIEGEVEGVGAVVAPLTGVQR